MAKTPPAPEEIIIPPPVELKDDDIFEAMKGIEGYLDITPGDFKELYSRAYRHAMERLTRGLKVKDVMTAPAVFVQLTTPLLEVAERMARSGISGVPVVDGNTVVAGVISEKDFIRRLAGEGTKNFMGLVANLLQSKSCINISWREETAVKLMKSPVITVRETNTVFETAHLLVNHNINRAPVIDGAGKLLGIVSRADIIQALL
jgi:CBS-domain-containing membrane protein